MPIFQSAQVRANLPLPSANGATAAILAVGDFVLPAGLVTDDIFEMTGLPAGYVVTDVLVDHEILGAAFTAGVGLMTGDYRGAANRTCGVEFIAAATYQAAAVKRLTSGARIAPTTNDRGIGVVISGTLTTPSVGNRIRVTVTMRPQSEGV